MEESNSKEISYKRKKTIKSILIVVCAVVLVAQIVCIVLWVTGSVAQRYVQIGQSICLVLNALMCLGIVLWRYGSNKKS